MMGVRPVKKTDAILQFLSGCDTPQATSEIAAGIGEADDTKGVGSLLSYLAGQRGFVAGERVGESSAEKSWTITAAGRQWFDDLQDEQTMGGRQPDSARRIVAKRAREKASDPEKIAPKKKANVARSPRGKLQRKTAEVQQPAAQPDPAAALIVVERTTPARQIAVRDDGAVLVLEGGQIVSTLLPEDAQRIALVVNRLSGAVHGNG